MKKEISDIADLLTDESFINYCKRTSSEDVIYWEDYIQQYPEKRELIESARETFLALFNLLAITDKEEQLERLKKRIDTKEEVPVAKMEDAGKKRAAKKRPFWLVIAAAASLIIVISVLTIRHFTHEKARAIKVFSTAYGERKNIQLPDGSVISLNAGSKIEIDEKFGVAARNIYLEGEAFFEVKHDANKPFIVHTPAMDVKALGTSFDVKAYKGERMTETSLIKGLAAVTLKEENNKVVILRPNEKVTWRGNLTDMVNEKEPLQPGVTALENEDIIPKILKPTNRGDIKEIAWKENKLVFEDDTLADIAVLLERWYGVDIDFQNKAIKNYRFTGVFEKENLETVLGFLKESRKFNFEIEQEEAITVKLSK